MLEAEAALRDSEERFRQMADAINAVFWMRDTAINRIFYVSPAYQRIWGRSLESLYHEPKSFLDAILPEDLKLRIPFFNESERPAETQYRIRQPNGSVRWIKDRAFPIRDASAGADRRDRARRGHYRVQGSRAADSRLSAAAASLRHSSPRPRSANAGNSPRRCTMISAKRWPFRRSSWTCFAAFAAQPSATSQSRKFSLCWRRPLLRRASLRRT